MIAHEIHDSVGQLLTAVKPDVARLGKFVSNRVEGELRKVILEKTDDIIRSPDKAIGATRDPVTKLRPGELDTLGLTAAIEWQIEQFRSRTNMYVETWLCSEPKGLRKEKSTALFRIFQESLTNIIRHAQASSVVIHLIDSDNELTMKVTDNGRGLSSEELNNPKSLGLLGMRELALAVGGDVTFEGTLGNGTIVTARIPMDRIKVTTV